MEQFLDKLLILHNDITLNIDFANKIVIKAFKSNNILAQNMDFVTFIDLFCEEENLDHSVKIKMLPFFENLKPSNEPFSLIASFKKKKFDSGSESTRYEFRGLLDNNQLVVTISNLENQNIDSFDTVTKVYNREVVIKKIKAEINDKHPFALLILDIDNFKDFNDTYGHMFGDIILVETVASIKSTIGPKDYIGRIGGDEFLVVIHTPNNSYEEIHTMCSKMKTAIQLLSHNNIKQASITATIGCAIYPKDADNYELLFKKADKALYRGKRKGRNCFIIYTLEKCGAIDDYALSESYTDIETIDKTSTNAQVIVGVYEILVRNNSIKKNLMDALSLIGNFFLIERIHLDITNLGQDKNVVIEWVNPQIKEYGGLIKPISESYNLWVDQFDQTGMIKYNQVKKEQVDLPYIKLLLEQKTTSILAFQLNFMEKELGVVRFDTCTTNKFWQAPEVSTLMVISKILAVTINKFNEQTAIEQFVSYDILTGLYTFSKFKNEIFNYKKNNKYSLIYIDIQHFSEINNSYGTLFGDKILKVLGEAIRKKASNNLYCRISNEKFLIYTTTLDQKKIKTMFFNIASTVQEEFKSDLKLIIRAGVYKTTTNEDLNTAIDMAHNTLYSIGQVDETTILFFDKNLAEKYQFEHSLINHMYKALENNEFLLYLQPKVEIKTGKLYGAEALSRWNYKHEELLYPNTFIPIFEKTGFINNLDFFIFEKVCAFLQKLKKENKELIIISVNISRYQTNLDKYISTIEDIRKKYGIDARYIEIEVTEGMYIKDVNRIEALVNRLHKLHYHVSMDDFGSGYSNLSSLAQLNFDMIKLDRSLIAEKTEGKGRPILTFIKELTNNLNVKVLCEGVESQKVAEILDSIGYHLGQGFLYDMPLPEEEFKIKYLNN